VNFYGNATRLTAGDVDAAANALGVPAAALWMICDVESAGAGFLPDKRPKILYEAHIFYRLTDGRFGVSNVSYPRWNRVLYGAGGAHQYDRLAQAMKLDERAALEACSWGMFQILGENAAHLGYRDVYDMVAQLRDGGESAHLESAVRFCRRNGLVDDLQPVPPHFAVVARTYNGPGYAAQGYDRKLEAAWRKRVAGVKEDWPMPRTDPDAFHESLQRGSMDDARVVELQRALGQLGYELTADGDFGPLTEHAVVDFQRGHGLRPDGIVGPRTRAALEGVIERRLW